MFSEVYWKDLDYGIINIDGEIDGVKDLDIGLGVDVHLGETVRNTFIP